MTHTEPPLSPEEIGERLSRGEITEADANEWMARHIQQAAFGAMQAGMTAIPRPEEDRPSCAPPDDGSAPA